MTTPPKSGPTTSELIAAHRYVHPTVREISVRSNPRRDAPVPTPRSTVNHSQGSPRMHDAPERAVRALPRQGAPRQLSARHQELVALVNAARAGESSAWNELVRRFDQTLHHIARSYRLSPTDVDDVVQATWLNLLEDIGRLRDSAAVAGWLATTTRRKAMRLLQSRVREQLTCEPELMGDDLDDDGPEASVLAAERRAILDRALATLPCRHRKLMTLLLTQPALDYRQVGERLGMPIGSIGPIRARSLARLSDNPELRAHHDGLATVHHMTRARVPDTTPLSA
jgi:RNA polymerase sigma factor (sigma-70 family)